MSACGNLSWIQSAVGGGGVGGRADGVGRTTRLRAVTGWKGVTVGRTMEAWHM